MFFTLLLLAQSGSSSHCRIRDSHDPNLSALYHNLQLAGLGLKEEIYRKAVAGYKRLLDLKLIQNPGVLSIVDLSQSSNSKRLYVIDVLNQTLLYQTYVAHGRNSGEEFANNFGNVPQSYRSSLGFYLTGQTYQGAHGLSLKLHGTEKGINDRAEQRGIVMHGADYVSEDFIKRNGRLGRSQGCPAVPVEVCEPIVNSIKEGSCLFVYYPDQAYFHTSGLCSTQAD